MKSCPACHRTFEDTLTFCLVDGSILSAPFDPQKTQRSPEARNTTPPPTQAWPPAVRNPGPAQPPFISPPFQVNPGYPVRAAPVKGFSLIKWIPLGLFVLWVIGVIGHLGGGVINLLLLTAIVLFVINLLRRR